jgi:hypothetical protein
MRKCGLYLPVPPLDFFRFFPIGQIDNKSDTFISPRRTLRRKEQSRLRQAYIVYK